MIQLYCHHPSRLQSYIQLYQYFLDSIEGDLYRFIFIPCTARSPGIAR